MKPTVGNRVLQANKALLEDGLKAILIQEVVRMLQKKQHRYTKRDNDRDIIKIQSKMITEPLSPLDHSPSFRVQQNTHTAIPGK